jgi:pSer/pThr/pTyr-binding forkhead associated (FHA) protein
LFTELSVNEYTIGGAQECKIKISCLEVAVAIPQTISKKHCKIVKATPEVYLEDLSFNGMYVNSEKLEKARRELKKNNDPISLVSPDFRGMCFNKTVT